MLIRYGTNEGLKEQTCYLDPNGNKIKEYEVVKDLGYWASNDGSSEQHIDKIVQSSCNISGWILRTFQTRDHEDTPAVFNQPNSRLLLTII